MKKYAILNNGCVREDAMVNKFICNMATEGIERSKSVEDCGYFIYSGCVGVGETIEKDIKDIITILKCKDEDAKLYIVGCISRYKLLADYLKPLIERGDVIIINYVDWPTKVINSIQEKNNYITRKIMLENRTKNFFGCGIEQTIHIEKGCPNRCSFCKTNYVDSTVKSIPYNLLLNYVNELAQKGMKIINLSGENTSVYGIDLCKEKILHKLIHDISLIDGIEYINVGEIAPQNMYPQLLSELQNNNKLRVVGIQIETASDRLLKLMNRGHDAQYLHYLLGELRKNPNIFINTIIMSGFPTETMDDMNDTINFTKENNIHVEGVCEYCDYDEIPSHNLEQFSKEEKRSHTKYICDIIRTQRNELMKRKMANLNEAIIIGKENNNTFLHTGTQVLGISITKEFSNKEIGEKVVTAPKKLVKKNKMNKRLTYRY